LSSELRNMEWNLIYREEMQVTRSVIYCSGSQNNLVVKHSPELRQFTAQFAFPLQVSLEMME